MEKMADNLLSKSEAPEEIEDDKVKAEDIVDEDVPDVKDTKPPVKAKEEDEEDEEEVPAEPEEDADLEKSEDLDEDEESDEDEEEDKFKAKEEISKALEVSEFLAALVEATTESIGGMNKKLNKSMDENSAVLGTFAKSFQAIASSQEYLIKSQIQLDNLLKGMSQSIDTLSQKVEELEGQPTMRKSVQNIHVMEKDFKKSVGDFTEETLSKSQILGKLNDFLMKGDPTVTVGDIVGFESGAPLRPEVKTLIGIK